MRSFVVVVVSIFFAASLVGNSQAVGLYVVGKEECDCSPLVARGIVPDTLNKLKEAFVLPQMIQALDWIALEIKGMVANLGPAPSEGLAEPSAAPEPTEKEKQELEKAPKEQKPALEKPVKEKKPATQLKKDEKPKKKKRVKMPPRTA